MAIVVLIDSRKRHRFSAEGLIGKLVSVWYFKKDFTPEQPVLYDIRYKGASYLIE